MAPAKSPTVRQRRLARELRELRQAAGLSGEDVARQLEWSAAKISRIETNKVGVHPRDVMGLLEIYGITDVQHRENLLTLTREARQKGWWTRYSDVLNQAMETIVGIEAEAVAVTSYDAYLVSGLLQTENYARAVIRSVSLPGKAAEIEQRVSLRMARQGIFDSDTPPTLHVIVDEGALLRPVGGREVMREQLQHLLDMSERPNVELQVLTLSIGAHAGIDGSFAIVRLPDPNPADPKQPDPEQEIVYIDYAMGSFFLESDEEVSAYRRTVDRLWVASRNQTDSVAFIHNLTKEN
jgi:transcriptional regulator with XRE-family HTH domain